MGGAKGKDRMTRPFVGKMEKAQGLTTGKQKFIALRLFSGDGGAGEAAFPERPKAEISSSQSCGSSAMHHEAGKPTRASRQGPRLRCQPPGEYTIVCESRPACLALQSFQFSCAALPFCLRLSILPGKKQGLCRSALRLRQTNVTNYSGVKILCIFVLDKDGQRTKLGLDSF